MFKGIKYRHEILADRLELVRLSTVRLTSLQIHANPEMSIHMYGDAKLRHVTPSQHIYVNSVYLVLTLFRMLNKTAVQSETPTHGLQKT